MWLAWLLFIGICIPIRLLFVIITKRIQLNKLPYLGYIGVVISLGFLYQTIKNNRKIGFLGQPVWWSLLRWVHCLNYGMFAILAFKKLRFAYLPLLIDVLIGVVLFAVQLPINNT